MGNLIIPIVLLIVIITCLIIFLVATKNKGTDDKILRQFYRTADTDFTCA